MRALRARRRLSPAVVKPGCADGGCGNEGNGDEGVGDSAMMLEALNRAGESPNDVEVGGLGGEHGGQRCVGGFAIESGASDAGAGKEVRDGFHACWDPYQRQRTGLSLTAQPDEAGASTYNPAHG